MLINGIAGKKYYLYIMSGATNTTVKLDTKSRKEAMKTAENLIKVCAPFTTIAVTREGTRADGTMIGGKGYRKFFCETLKLIRNW